MTLNVFYLYEMDQLPYCIVLCLTDQVCAVMVSLSAFTVGGCFCVPYHIFIGGWHVVSELIN